MATSDYQPAKGGGKSGHVDGRGSYNSGSTTGSDKGPESPSDASRTGWPENTGGSVERSVVQVGNPVPNTPC